MFAVIDTYDGAIVAQLGTWQQAARVATWMTREFLCLFIVREVRH